MKRLTEYTIPETGFSVVSKEKYKRILMEEKTSVEKVYNRLKKIEDILGDEYDLDELKEMVQAKREGRCVVLPCRLGDKLFYEDDGETVDEVVDKIVIEIETDGGIYEPRDIGYSVYLSPEAALKAREQDG